MISSLKRVRPKRRPPPPILLEPRRPFSLPVLASTGPSVETLVPFPSIHGEATDDGDSPLTTHNSQPTTSADSSLLASRSSQLTTSWGNSQLTTSARNFPDGDPFNPHKILNHFDRLKRLVDGELVSPITVEIDPTNVCNHRCKWCVSIEAHTGEVIELPRFRTLIEELRKCDVRSVVLKGGGEPSTHPDFIEMLGAVRDAGLDVGLITNGSMPRPLSRDKVLECCQWVRVSLDAATAGTHRVIHGTTDFVKILNNIQYLTSRSARTMIGLNFVAEPRNYQEMVDFAQLGRSIGAAYVSIRCVFDPQNPLPENIRAAMRQNAFAARQLESDAFRVFLGNFTDRYLSADASQPFPYSRCLGPNLVGVVGGDGEVYACCFLRGNRKFSFGNVNGQSFSEIWSSAKRQEVMQSVYRGECNRVCAGGMTANRYNTYNEILNYMAAEEKKHGAFA